MLDAQIGEPQHAHALRHVVEDVVGDGRPRGGYTSRFPSSRTLGERVFVSLQVVVLREVKASG